MMSRSTASHSFAVESHDSARLVADAKEGMRAVQHLCDEELFALCTDPDPTITLLNYLLVTRREEGGRLRLRPVSQMNTRAQQLFFTHFDAQKLVELASDAAASRELRAAAVAVLDSCTTGGWRFRVGHELAEIGQMAGTIVHQQAAAGQRNRAVETLGVFTSLDRATSRLMVDAIALV